MIVSKSKLANQLQRSPAEDTLRSKLSELQTEKFKLLAQIQEMEGLVFEKQRLKCNIEELNTKLKSRDAELITLAEKHQKLQKQLSESHDEIIALKIHMQSAPGKLQTVRSEANKVSKQTASTAKKTINYVGKIICCQTSTSVKMAVNLNSLVEISRTLRQHTSLENVCIMRILKWLKIWLGQTVQGTPKN